MGAGWALDNLEARLNFGYLAVHRVTETAKAVIRIYYGHPPAHSYFVGCSRGGGQALMEAQRYPADFDGIVAGAPAFYWTGFTAAMVQAQQVSYPDPADVGRGVVTPDAVRRMAETVMAQCDGRDGVIDGIIDDPPACTVDPAAVPGLTEAQRNFFRTVYDGPAGIYPGLPRGAENGSEFALWVTGPDEGLLKSDGVPNAWFGFGTEFFKYFVFNDPQWSYAGYDFARWRSDTHLTGTYMDAVDADLRAFKKRGGKLILWHGWADAALSARATVDYYRAVERTDLGVRDYARLFLLPGVGHCGSGVGCNRVDWLGAVVDWVERDRPPGRITARREDESGRVIRTRPLHPYPLRAVYRGSGSTDDEQNFILPPP
jgi:feruloyl esterase